MIPNNDYRTPTNAPGPTQETSPPQHKTSHEVKYTEAPSISDVPSFPNFPTSPTRRNRFRRKLKLRPRLFSSQKKKNEVHSDNVGQSEERASPNQAIWSHNLRHENIDESEEILSFNHHSRRETSDDVRLAESPPMTYQHNVLLASSTSDHNEDTSVRIRRSIATYPRNNTDTNTIASHPTIDTDSRSNGFSVMSSTINSWAPGLLSAFEKTVPSRKKEETSSPSGSK